MLRMTVLMCALIVSGMAAVATDARAGTTNINKKSEPRKAVVRPRESGELRVMSFNIRVSTMVDMGNTWGLRKGLLVNTIKQFNPDLLGTQESLAAQSDYLRENLPGYEFVGVGRNNGKRKGEMC